MCLNESLEKALNLAFYKNIEIVVLFGSIFLNFTFYLMCFMWPVLVYKDLHRRKHVNVCNHVNPFHISCFIYR